MSLSISLIGCDHRALDQAEARFRKAVEQKDEWKWTFTDNGVAQVQNWRTGQTYTVTDADCTCKDHRHRGQYTGIACKHRRAYALVRLERGF